MRLTENLSSLDSAESEAFLLASWGVRHIREELLAFAGRPSVELRRMRETEFLQTVYNYAPRRMFNDRREIREQMAKWSRLQQKLASEPRRHGGGDRCGPVPQGLGRTVCLGREGLPWGSLRGWAPETRGRKTCPRATSGSC